MSESIASETAREVVLTGIVDSHSYSEQVVAIPT
jgi:hypothetical protein